MKNVIATEKLPIKLWLNDIEEGALEQAKNLANLPFAFKHIAIMPDSHQGYGMPIGGVLATKRVVIPNAVGMDIGCGMLAVKTNLTEIKKNELQTVVNMIKSRIPVGFEWNQKPDSYVSGSALMQPCTDIIKAQLDNASLQAGTLGGGNHFIEIQKGSDGCIWFMIHSGSRNLGKIVAEYYNDIAKKLNEKWYSTVQKDLAFLPIDTQEGKDYLKDMEFCRVFATYNREKMGREIKDVFEEIFPNIEFTKTVHIAHNYARFEHHFGENVIVHRKGATSAKEGELGVIPGSMGSKSYIVRGLGNKQSFFSCSHGAGRKLGRGAAKRELNLEEQQNILDSQNILHDVSSVENLDEAPGAYKDIDEVMENQSDLVEILVELKPLAVIKG